MRTAKGPNARPSFRRGENEHYTGFLLSEVEAQLEAEGEDHYSLGDYPPMPIPEEEPEAEASEE